MAGYLSSSAALMAGPPCPGCQRRWPSLRPDGASRVGSVWLEYRTCQKCQHTVSAEVSRTEAIRACQVAINHAIEFTPERVPHVVPTLVSILGREAMR